MPEVIDISIGGEYNKLCKIVNYNDTGKSNLKGMLRRAYSSPWKSVQEIANVGGLYEHHEGLLM